MIYGLGSGVQRFSVRKGFEFSTNTVDGQNRASPATSRAWHVHRLAPLAPLMSMLITRAGDAGIRPFVHKPLLTVLGNKC